MRFIDHCRIKVVAGDGGNGAAAFRREKFIPFGGPSGGDGGRGGNVTLVGDEGMSTLQDVTHQRTITADRGGHGLGSDMYGRGGADRIVKIPVGTQVFDDETGEILVDVTEPGQELLVAKGGQGGRGNIHFASSFDRAPRRFEKGGRGEVRTLRLELKVMADVGLLGFPNVGKSTFVASVSAARPKVADYAFTTLVPTLGVVEMHGGPRLGGSSFVMADIPGLIPGASEGIGLGIQFLKHVERTRALLHLITLDFAEGREPFEDYIAIREELAKFSPDLATRPEVVALSKIDISEVREAYPELKARFARHGIPLRAVSAATREGLDDLLNLLERVVRGTVEAGELGTPRLKKPKAKSKSKPVAKAKATTQAKPAGKTKPSAKAKSGAKAKLAPKATRGVKAKPATKAKLVAKRKLSTKAKPAAKAKLRAKAKLSAKAKPAAKTKAKRTQPATTPTRRAKAKLPTKASRGAKAKPANKTKPKAGAKAAAKPVSKAKSASRAKTKSSSRPKAKASRQEPRKRA